ncbi:MAG: glycosyltransferase 87 family protein [Gemmatimonadales bacterium]
MMPAWPVTATEARVVDRRILKGAVRTGVTIALLVALIGIIVPAGLGWDFANFYDTGRRAAAGQVGDIYNPESPIGGAAPQGRMTFWGAPVSAWFYAPLAPLRPATALLLFKLAGTLAYAAALLLLFRHLAGAGGFGAEERRWFAAATIVLILLYQPFWTMYRVGGQTTPFVFLLLVAGLLSYERERFLAASACLLLAVLIKPAMLFVPAFLALVGGRRFFLTLTGVFVAGGLVSIALAGWPVHREFIEMARRGSSKPSPWFFNSSIYILADLVRPIEHSAPLRGAPGGRLAAQLGAAMKLAVLGVFVVLAVRFHRHRLIAPPRRRGEFMLALSFCLLVSQVVWEHYLALLFIPLLWLVSLGHRLPRGAVRWLGAVVLFSVLQNLVLIEFFREHVTISSHPVLLLVSLVKCAPLLLYLGWLLRYHRPLFAGVGLPGAGPVPAG